MPSIETADKTPIFYNDWGTGRAVVLIHGWPLNADMWEYQATHLVRSGFRVIAYDRRGFGRSGQPWNGYDYDTFADDLHALVTKLNLTDIALVGFSMGGGDVARYVGRHGGGVTRAALISAVTPFLLKTPENPDGVDRATFDQMVDGLKQDRPHFLANFGKKFFGAGMLNFAVSTEILQWAAQLALQASAHATIECVRAFSETDFRPDLPAFKMPTLIVHGTGDETVPASVSAERTARAIPGATMKLYEGEPHALVFTAKDRLNADLVAFLRG